MPFDINQGDLQRANEINNTPSNYAGSVGSGSTASSVVDAVGGFATNQWTDFGIQFTSNTTTTALQGVWRQITSNTADALALAAALPATPVVGDQYNIRPFGQQTLNINSVGGTAQTGADWTTFFSGIWGAIATIGSAIKATAMQIAGSDGTNARTISTDTTGALNLAAGTNSIGGVTQTPSTALYDGQASVTTTAAAIASSQAITEVLLTADPGNANGSYVYVGNATSQNTPLAPGQSMTLSVSNLDLIYAKASSGTLALDYLGRS